MINIYIDNHPFKVFANREDKGGRDLECDGVGETN
jgi:hypothetical protein